MYADFIKRIYLDEMILSHGDSHVIFCLSRHIRHDTPVHGLSVHGERLHTLLHVVGIHHLNVVSALAELAG